MVEVLEPISGRGGGPAEHAELGEAVTGSRGAVGCCQPLTPPILITSVEGCQASASQAAVIIDLRLPPQVMRTRRLRRMVNSDGLRGLVFYFPAVRLRPSGLRRSCGAGGPLSRLQRRCWLLMVALLRLQRRRRPTNCSIAWVTRRPAGPSRSSIPWAKPGTSMNRAWRDRSAALTCRGWRVPSVSGSSREPT